MDRGAILLQDSVALAPDSAAAPVERAKTRLARSKLNELLDQLASPTDAPVEQEGPGSSYSRAELRAIRTVTAPEKLSLREHELRLRAFEIVDLELAGHSWRTTALRRIGRRPRNRQLAFTTSDGVAVEPSRLMHQTPRLYRRLRSTLGAAEKSAV